jgi:hypothetical protein
MENIAECSLHELLEYDATYSLQVDNKTQAHTGQDMGKTREKRDK